MSNSFGDWLRRIVPLAPIPGNRYYQRQKTALYSNALQREVKVDLYVPPHFTRGGLPLLLVNDGQDLEAVQLMAHLRRLFREGQMAPVLAAGLHAGDRLREYGVAGRPDYKNRGAKSAAYQRFITRELTPRLQSRYRLRAPYTFAGFSLGGLSAFDAVWNHPNCFQQVGVFSGAFWWRSRPFDPQAPDAHRIAHARVRQTQHAPNLRFWLQTGTADETADRNNNGVIDSIDDTRDLIRELEKHGFREGEHIRYVEVEGGQHHPATWARVMPDFLRWAFPANE